MAQISVRSMESLITSRPSYEGMKAGFAVERRTLKSYGKRLSDEKIGRRIAEQKMTLTIMSVLSIAGIRYQWRNRWSGKWLKIQKELWRIADNATGFSWQKENKTRTLIYNVSIPLIDQTVDLCVFDTSPKSIDPSNAKSYVAFGKYDGEIDATVAAKNWKTARAKLKHIRSAFSLLKCNPSTFFISAAIKEKMALELWYELQQGTLSNAANLNDDMQLASISRWLCNL
jgi:hypothetical protein